MKILNFIKTYRKELLIIGGSVLGAAILKATIENSVNRLPDEEIEVEYKVTEADED